MVSLGPLSPKKYCTYSCPHCYVHADFLSYGAVPIDGVMSYLSEHRAEFDIVYVSGDTDSFAPPRADAGIDLLKRCAEFDVDVLFTTRAILSDAHRDELGRLAEQLRARGRSLIGCVSVAQLRHRHLEPPPIAESPERIAQLLDFRRRGLAAVLAMRPLLPIVPTEEYLEIVDRCGQGIDLVISDGWYADQAGKLDKGVFGDQPVEYEHTLERMDFDDNEAVWKVYRPTKVIETIEQHCKGIGVPFFSRSAPAVAHIRNTRT
jgi:DNA repair photolyase